MSTSRIDSTSTTDDKPAELTGTPAILYDQVSFKMPIRFEVKTDSIPERVLRPLERVES